MAQLLADRGLRLPSTKRRKRRGHAESEALGVGRHRCPANLQRGNVDSRRPVPGHSLSYGDCGRCGRLDPRDVLVHVAGPPPVAGSPLNQSRRQSIRRIRRDDPPLEGTLMACLRSSGNMARCSTGSDESRLLPNDPMASQNGDRDLRRRAGLHSTNIPRPAAGSCLRWHLAAYADPATPTALDRIRTGQRLFHQVWQVLGSNQRRLSRRFYSCAHRGWSRSREIFGACGWAASWGYPACGCGATGLCGLPRPWLRRDGPCRLPQSGCGIWGPCGPAGGVGWWRAARDAGRFVGSEPVLQLGAGT
jgi:hypothetical protein